MPARRTIRATPKAKQAARRTRATPAPAPADPSAQAPTLSEALRILEELGDIDATVTVMARLYATYCPELPPSDEVGEHMTILAAGILRDDPDSFWNIARGESEFQPFTGESHRLE